VFENLVSRLRHALLQVNGTFLTSKRSPGQIVGNSLLTLCSPSWVWLENSSPSDFLISFCLLSTTSSVRQIASGRIHESRTKALNENNMTKPTKPEKTEEKSASVSFQADKLPAFACI
jgi:hypothetical protein